MSNQFYFLLGSAGSVISVAGNLPMLIHLYKVKDSTGQSLRAWWVWNLANVMMLIYAIHIRDIVFTALQIAWIIFCSATIVLIMRYRKTEATK